MPPTTVDERTLLDWLFGPPHRKPASPPEPRPTEPDTPAPQPPPVPLSPKKDGPPKDGSQPPKDGQNPGGNDSDKPKPPKATEPAFPRRALVIGVNDYLYLDPINPGRLTEAHNIAALPTFHDVCGVQEIDSGCESVTLIESGPAEAVLPDESLTWIKRPV